MKEYQTIRQKIAITTTFKSLKNSNIQRLEVIHKVLMSEESITRKTKPKKVVKT